MISELKNDLKNRGFIHAIKTLVPLLYRSVRRIAPSTGEYIVFNGVRIADRKVTDGILWSSAYLPPTSNKPEYKCPNLSCIQNHVGVGDTVVVIGAGLGVTTVVAAKESKTGDIYAYEASDQRVHDLTRVLRINNVDKQCSVFHSIVGEDIEAIGTTSDANITVPASIPSCDVLELDCEGAEIGIISELVNPLPKTIILETHPRKGADTDSVINLLNEKGYQTTESIDDPIEGDVIVAKQLESESDDYI